MEIYFPTAQEAARRSGDAARISDAGIFEQGTDPAFVKAVHDEIDRIRRENGPPPSASNGVPCRCRNTQFWNREAPAMVLRIRLHRIIDALMVIRLAVIVFR